MHRQIFRTATRSVARTTFVPRNLPAFRRFSSVNDAERDAQMKREEAEMMEHDKVLAAATKPGLVIFSPSGAYAQAILDSCLEHKLDPKAVHAGLDMWNDAYTGDEELRRFMDDESIGWEGCDPKTDLAEHANKDAALAGKDQLLEGAVYPEVGLGDSNEHTLCKQSIEMLQEDGQIPLMGEVADDFERLALHHLKQVKCVVTSAEALSAAYQKKVVTKVQTMAPAGFTPLIAYEVDPTLLGGLTVLIGDSFQDLSARSAILDGETELRSM